jgi:hypothetical protein
MPAPATSGEERLRGKLSNMNTVIKWLEVGSWLGVPRTGWAVLSVVVLVDVIFAHVKSPYLNHAAGAVALLIQQILSLLQIPKIPVLGPAISGLLDVLIGVPPGGVPVTTLAAKGVDTQELQNLIGATTKDAVIKDAKVSTTKAATSEEAVTPNDRPPVPPKAA